MIRETREILLSPIGVIFVFGPASLLGLALLTDVMGWSHHVVGGVVLGTFALFLVVMGALSIWFGDKS